MIQKSNEEYVILKYGEEAQEIRYFQNGILYLGDDSITEIIGDDQLKTLNTIQFESGFWEDCKFHLPNTIKTLYINQTFIKIPDFLDNFPQLENLNISENYGFNLGVLRKKIKLKTLAFWFSGIVYIIFSHLSS